jgi:hypothetical protein
MAVITMFRTRDAAWAAAKELSQLVPAHDYEAWPDRGYWVLVMRYRDDDGHIRFQFVGPCKPEPQRRSPQERPVAHGISDRGDASVRRHRRVNVEAIRQ